MTATTHKPHGAVPEAPPIEAPAPVMAEARAKCAELLRAEGHDAEADMFATGQRDGAWRMKHIVAKLMREAEGV